MKKNKKKKKKMKRKKKKKKKLGRPNPDFRVHQSPRGPGASPFFFYFFMKSPTLSCPLWSKNVKYVKTTLYVPEKSIECLFFFRFVTKN